MRRKNSLFTNVAKRVNGGSGSIGIVNTVNNSGTLTIYDSSTKTSFDLLDTIKTLQQQIEQLSKNINGGTK